MMKVVITPACVHFVRVGVLERKKGATLLTSPYNNTLTSLVGTHNVHTLTTCQCQPWSTADGQRCRVEEAVECSAQKKG